MREHWPAEARVQFEPVKEQIRENMNYPRWACETRAQVSSLRPDLISSGSRGRV